MATLAQLLEQYLGLGTFLVAGTLTVLSAIAWRRERDRRMAIVTGAYLLFAVFGLVKFLEYLLYPYAPVGLVEVIEHGAGGLVLAGLLAFFLALSRD
ncbi:MAG: hypothetical protein ABEI96_09095 [Haloarculaceae archaeon]